MGTLRGITSPSAALRLAPIDGSSESVAASANDAGAFAFSNVGPGWYVLSSSLPFAETARAIRINAADLDIGPFNLPPTPRSAQGGISIVTVCEALTGRDYLNYRQAVIVGIFKSGMDETLRLDCPTQLVSADLGWPSSIGLTRPTNPPDSLRDQVEKKRQEILKSAPPEAPLRPERVIGLYGVFVSLAGLTSAPCCKASVETTLPPARLFGVAETDLRVIR